MGYQIYRVGNRWGGYGVPATCEHPDCNEEIDRGVSFACGGEPFSEHGCDRYFCSKHLNYTYFNPSTGKKCRHKKDCDCDLIQVCERCAAGKVSFDYKPEHKTWLKHILNHRSWQKWRHKNSEEVAEYKKQLEEINK